MRLRVICGLATRGWRPHDGGAQFKKVSGALPPMKIIVEIYRWVGGWVGGGGFFFLLHLPGFFTALAVTVILEGGREGGGITGVHLGDCDTRTVSIILLFLREGILVSCVCLVVLEIFPKKKKMVVKTVVVFFLSFFLSLEKTGYRTLVV